MNLVYIYIYTYITMPKHIPDSDGPLGSRTFGKPQLVPWSLSILEAKSKTSRPCKQT